MALIAVGALGASAFAALGAAVMKGEPDVLANESAAVAPPASVAREAQSSQPLRAMRTEPRRLGSARIEPTAGSQPSPAMMSDGQSAEDESRVAALALHARRLEDERREFAALGLRVRPLSDSEKRDMGATGAQQGWKIINVTRRQHASLRVGDVIVGPCAEGARASFQETIENLIDDMQKPRCLVVLRNGDMVRVGPGETGPSE